MTPSIIVIYICSTVFVVLFFVFSIFLIKTSGAAKARQVSKKLPSAISKQMPPANDGDYAEVVQSRLSISKAK